MDFVTTFFPDFLKFANKLFDIMIVLYLTKYVLIFINIYSFDSDLVYRMQLMII